jgi:thioredoxin-like negative regulator of GroEL
VRRQFRRAHAADTAVAVPSGQAELAALEHAPTDHQRAVALAEVLLARADGDAGFAAALAAWWAQASQIEAGQVTSTITSGTFHGPVLQGRDFTGLTLTTPPPAPPALDPGA